MHRKEATKKERNAKAENCNYPRVAVKFWEGGWEGYGWCCMWSESAVQILRKCDDQNDLQHGEESISVSLDAFDSHSVLEQRETKQAVEETEGTSHSRPSCHNPGIA